MNILDIVSRESIKVPLESREKLDAIRELVHLLSANGGVEDASTLESVVLKREQDATTGIGHGLAVPHGKCEAVKSFAIAFGIPEQPLDFNSIDGRPVRLVVLVASPPDRMSDHIQLLAQLSRLVNHEEIRTRLYESKSADELYDVLTDAVPAP